MTTTGRKVAIISGGSRGIGKATSLLLAQHDYDVAIIYSRKARDAEETVKELETLGAKAAYFECDMGSGEKAIIELIRKVHSDFGRIDVLVNSAARGLSTSRNSLLEASPELLDEALRVNVLGALFASREVSKYMRLGSSIINLVSTGTVSFAPEYGPVGMSKAAVIKLTQDLAVELAPKGIRVNAVLGGLVEGTTGFRALGLLEKRAERQGKLEELPIRISAYTERIPLGRNVSPEDMAKAIFALTSELLPMTTGHILVVDGGIGLLTV